MTKHHDDNNLIQVCFACGGRLTRKRGCVLCGKRIELPPQNAVSKKAVTIYSSWRTK